MLLTLLKHRFVPWLLLAALAFVTALYQIAYYRGQSQGEQAVQALWDAERLVQLQEYAELQSRYSEITHQLKQDAKALSEDLRGKLNATEQEYQSVVADLRSGNLRLRQQWQSCSADLSGASSTTGAAGRNDDPDQAGVPPEAVERILRIGTEADQVAIRLQSCQEYVERITETFAGQSNK